MIIKTREMQDMTQVLNAADNTRIGSVRPVGIREDGETIYLVNVYKTRSRFEIAMDRDAAIGHLIDRHIKA